MESISLCVDFLSVMLLRVLLLESVILADIRFFLRVVLLSFFSPLRGLSRVENDRISRVGDASLPANGIKLDSSFLLDGLPFPTEDNGGDSIVVFIMDRCRLFNAME